MKRKRVKEVDFGSPFLPPKSTAGHLGQQAGSRYYLPHAHDRPLRANSLVVDVSLLLLDLLIIPCTCTCNLILGFN
jgi:hypothetical protein